MFYFPLQSSINQFFQTNWWKNAFHVILLSLHFNKHSHFCALQIVLKITRLEKKGLWNMLVSHFIVQSLYKLSILFAMSQIPRRKIDRIYLNYISFHWRVADILLRSRIFSESEFFLPHCEEFWDYLVFTGLMAQRHFFKKNKDTFCGCLVHIRDIHYRNHTRLWNYTPNFIRKKTFTCPASTKFQ